MPLAKLLIVDDEAAQLTALCQTLADEGYAPVGFTSANKALAALREQGFDLVLTDLMMPEMDGITLLRTAQELDPHLVGILMTGHGAIDTAVEAMRIGAIDYILKPFKLTAILPVLSRALAVRQLRIERTELEQRVRERTAELELVNEELEAFTGSVSHDLRAPLRHLVGFAGLLREKASAALDETSRRHLEIILEAGKQMERLIDDLLAFSKMGHSKMQQSFCNMHELVQEVIREMYHVLQGRNIHWKINSLPEVHADRPMLKQVWVNLLSNAVKYTRYRDPAKITVGWTKRESEHEFYVRDNGAGFDIAHVEKLFGVFQRLHPPEEFEGTGIGLANVRRIIHRHGGRTWAEGGTDAGATFFFTLPLKGQRTTQETVKAMMLTMETT